MGLLTTNPPSSQSTNPITIAPDRTARARCWSARDAFFACLDSHSIIDSLKDSEAATSACGKFDREFGKECAGSWVTYFKQRRVMEHNKKTTLERLAKEGAEDIAPNGGTLPPNLPKAPKSGR